MEAAQGLFTANRDANLLDAIANLCGVLLGMALAKPLLPAGLLYRLEQIIRAKSS